MPFSDANLVRAREIVARYPRAKSAILPLAHLAQDQDGWLTKEAMEEIAVLTGVTPAVVQGTCSFYTMFKRKPSGSLIVSVCTNVTCLVTGGPAILDELTRRYAEDDSVGVEEVECLAACGGAPALQVNYEYHELMTPDTAASLVDDYKSGRLAARTVSGSKVAGSATTTGTAR
jgi:NADH-quinone oxidoreductase subunit E